MKAALVALLVACVPASALLYNVDQPVPLSLVHGEYYVGMRLWGEGGAVARVAVGLFDRITVGASYGGDRFLGARKPILHPRPEFQARAAILMEQGYIPDLAVGIETQGGNGFDEERDRYVILPSGGYVGFGKTVDVSRTYLQLGVNYWKRVSGFAVVNQQLPGGFELILEYDAALNDEERDIGYLNFGMGWTFGDKARFCIGVRDLLGPEGSQFNRVVDLSFHDLF
ncbi:MAG: hypothetical protein JSU73_07300 [candidate division WOR-3 bacterium]|nr:MAG: hypothetical protein JSU73_07300 [candidate division WOR-3 bacterium]